MEAAGNETGYLVDGFPRNEDNLEGWKTAMGAKTTTPFVLFIQCPEEVIITVLCLPKRGVGADVRVAVPVAGPDEWANGRQRGVPQEARPDLQQPDHAHHPPLPGPRPRPNRRRRPGARPSSPNPALPYHPWFHLQVFAEVTAVFEVAGFKKQS